MYKVQLDDRNFYSYFSLLLSRCKWCYIHIMFHLMLAASFFLSSRAICILTPNLGHLCENSIHRKMSRNSVSPSFHSQTFWLHNQINVAPDTRWLLKAFRSSQALSSSHYLWDVLWLYNVLTVKVKVVKSSQHYAFTAHLSHTTLCSCLSCWRIWCF